VGRDVLGHSEGAWKSLGGGAWKFLEVVEELGSVFPSLVRVVYTLQTRGGIISSFFCGRRSEPIGERRGTLNK
jgi:hypothetical protein